MSGFSNIAVVSAGDERGFSKSATTGARTGEYANWALASRGATATASTPLSSGTQPSAVIDGIRHTSGVWNVNNHCYASNADPSAIMPVFIQVDFASAKTIDLINVINLSGDYNYSTDPTLADTASGTANKNFVLQYWNGTIWVDFITVMNNTNVWRQFSITPITTSKVKMVVTECPGGRCFLVELECFGS